MQLTKKQKASLCTFLKSFAKNNKTLNEDELLNKFIEDETYYYNINSPHLYFVAENLEDDDFVRDLKKYIEALMTDIKYKEKQKPYIEEQKKKLKEERKRAQDFKLKKEKPTPKQLKYYKNLSKKYNLELKNLENASKYDLKVWIGEILDNANK